jgi:hypothetical protein
LGVLTRCPLNLFEKTKKDAAPIVNAHKKAKTNLITQVIQNESKSG